MCVHFYRSPSCWMARWWATTLQGMPCHSSALNNISFFCCPLNKNGPFLLFLKKKIKILNFNELPRCHFSSGKFLWKLKYFAIYFNIICIFKLRILIRPKIVVWFFFKFMNIPAAAWCLAGQVDRLKFERMTVTFFHIFTCYCWRWWWCWAAGGVSAVPPRPLFVVADTGDLLPL